MSKKLVKCKSCGAEIAKTARTCPHCGAQQHQAALSACAIIIVITIIACIWVVMQPSDTDAPPFNAEAADTTIAASEDSKVIFAGSDASVSYMDVFEEPSVSGCYYIKLQIENTGDKKELIYLEDVYTDDLACNSGSGLPVEVLPGKKANGVFIVFYDGILDNVNAIEFKIVIADSETLDRIETSDQIALQMK